MEYRDVMGSLVDEWKKTITEWSDSNRRVLIDFNTFLERNAENEKLYQEQLEEILSAPFIYKFPYQLDCGTFCSSVFAHFHKPAAALL